MAREVTPRNIIAIDRDRGRMPQRIYDTTHGGCFDEPRKGWFMGDAYMQSSRFSPELKKFFWSAAVSNYKGNYLVVAF